MKNYNEQRAKLMEMRKFNCSKELISQQKQLVRSLRPTFAREDEM